MLDSPAEHPQNTRAVSDNALAPVAGCSDIKEHFAKAKVAGKINLTSVTEQEDFNMGKHGSQVFAA